MIIYIIRNKKLTFSYGFARNTDLAPPKPCDVIEGKGSSPSSTNFRDTLAPRGDDL